VVLLSHPWPVVLYGHDGGYGDYDGDGTELQRGAGEAGARAGGGGDGVRADEVHDSDDRNLPVTLRGDNRASRESETSV